MKVLMQGHREGGAEVAVCLRASGLRGPHQLISKFVFKASLDVFKEPPKRSSLQGTKSSRQIHSSRFPCFLPLLASITDTRGLILQFCPLGLENLSAALCVMCGILLFKKPQRNFQAPVSLAISIHLCLYGSSD